MTRPQPLTQLRAARRTRALTCAQLGAMIGKTHSHMAKIERGEVALSAADALTLCDVLGLDLATLLRREPVKA